MWKQPFDEDLFEKFDKYRKIAGVIFILLGTVGIIYPVFMTLATVTFISWLMLFGGLTAGYFTWISDKTDSIGWLKSVILIGAAVFMLLYPKESASAVGLLLAVYFFLDGFASFSIAFSMKQSSGSILWFLNAIFSVLIALLLFVNWPVGSMYLVGLLVGFSLFFDGVALLVGGSIFKNMLK